MRTIKLVVIGDSGVGKTSLRNQYVTEKFSTAYRATIGTDFITKTLPHHQNPDESVTLQIWDTAGQERFSSLSTAYFRGADAALLMFDVNRPETMHSLIKWWDTFKAYAPVRDEEAEAFCCVVVGNKIDLVGDSETTSRASSEEGGEEGTRKYVTEVEAERFLEELIPRSSAPGGPEDEDYTSEDDNEIDDPFISDGDPDHSRHSTGLFMRRAVSGFSLHSVISSSPRHIPAESEPEEGENVGNRTKHDHDLGSLPRTRSQSISIQPSNGHAQPFWRTGKPSHSTEDFSFLGGTMTTTHTTQTIYHTPSSSIFDHFESAPSSPFRDEHDLPLPSSSGSSAGGEPVTPNRATRLRRMTDGSSSSSSSAPTITPSLFLRTQTSHSTSSSGVPTPPTPLEINSSISPSFLPLTPANGDAANSRHPPRKRRLRPVLPPRPERRPRLFLTSAKTGAGVQLVFEHIAERVCMSWSYNEALEASGIRRECVPAAVPRGPRSDIPKLRLGLLNGPAGSRALWLRDRLNMKDGASSCCGS